MEEAELNNLDSAEPLACQKSVELLVKVILDEQEDVYQLSEEIILEIRRKKTWFGGKKKNEVELLAFNSNSAEFPDLSEKYLIKNLGSNKDEIRRLDNNALDRSVLLEDVLFYFAEKAEHTRGALNHILSARLKTAKTMLAYKNNDTNRPRSGPLPPIYYSHKGIPYALAIQEKSNPDQLEVIAGEITSGHIYPLASYEFWKSTDHIYNVEWERGDITKKKTWGELLRIFSVATRRGELVRPLTGYC